MAGRPSAPRPPPQHAQAFQWAQMQAALAAQQAEFQRRLDELRTTLVSHSQRHDVCAAAPLGLSSCSDGGLCRYPHVKCMSICAGAYARVFWVPGLGGNNAKVIFDRASATRPFSGRLPFIDTAFGVV